jgi:hypothetical protein
MEGFDLGFDVAISGGLEQVSEFRSDKRVATNFDLMVVECHPVLQRVGAVGIDEERCVEHFIDHDGSARNQDPSRL